MNNKERLSIFKQKLDNSADEYRQIVKVFEESTMNTEHMEEKTKMKIRMNALEIRCKDSQFLLENIIAALDENIEMNQLAKYKDTISKLLNSIRNELNKNNLLEMIKCLEKIPVVMSEIDNEIRISIGVDFRTLH